MANLTLTIRRDPQEVEAGEILIDGSVGGRPYQFLLDTGAAISRVGLDDYTIGFAPLERRSSSGVFQASSGDVIVVPSVQIGPISRKNISLARVAADANQVANLIGMDVLKDFRLYFDFANNLLGIDPTDDAGEGCIFHQMKLDERFHLYVDARCGQTTASAVWDSGASLTVVNTTFVNQHLTLFTGAGQSVGTDSTGHQMTTPMFVMSGLVIGNTTFLPHRIASVDLSGVNATVEVPMDVILGYSTISHADWLLDFPGRRWAIVRMRAAI